MCGGFRERISRRAMSGVGRSRRGTAGTWRPELPVKLGYLTLRNLAVPDNRRSRPVAVIDDRQVSGNQKMSTCTLSSLTAHTARRLQAILLNHLIDHVAPLRRLDIAPLDLASYREDWRFWSV